MVTKMLPPTTENLKAAVELLKSGEIVAIPTETVYGLGCNAFDTSAILKVFNAKGRPADNPLILHISSKDMLNNMVSKIYPLAQKIIDAFWPGPLTIIFPKHNNVSNIATAGLDTVAIRFPSNKIICSIIKQLGCPVAAPSANLSSSPSPTSAMHVFNDLNTKIPMIIDGGNCDIGLESTVIKIDDNKITLLRPGAITIDMLSLFSDNISTHQSVISEIHSNNTIISPGTKYKHYSPKTPIIILESSLDKFINFIEKNQKDNIGVMVFDGEESFIKNIPFITFGKEDDAISQGKLLFSSLRAIDELCVNKVYVRMPNKDGLGLAIYNRLIRAAGFKVIKL